MVKLRLTVAAAANAAVPAWLALMVQVPKATPVTVVPLVPLALQMPGVVLVITTGLPDPPPVVVTRVLPPTSMVGVVPSVITCGETGTTALDAAEAALLPDAFVARTVKVTLTPLVRPVTAIALHGAVQLPTMALGLLVAV